MDSFDIDRLTDFDFEKVCKDIFEAEYNVQLEIFAQGADQGVDLRYIATEGHRLIIQCKHWGRRNRAALLRHMKTTEKPKIRALDPERYVLATSVELSKQAKDALTKELSPYIKVAGDIYGAHEIESLLRARPEIVQRHLRLWLSSSAVLQAMLAKNILTRSWDLESDTRHAMLVYVPNDGFWRARTILDNNHVCIISGLPGIGKTTLAQILAATYAESGYDIYEISVDVDEINQLWSEEVPQFFYYDDFLGQTTRGDKLNKNEDSRLLRIIHRIYRMPNKRLVMTTREYILEDARQQYERLGSEDLNPLQCVLAIADYTRRIRAEILYNHIYFSELQLEDKTSFAAPAVYEPIINHRNFNPRLIDYCLRLPTIGEQPRGTVAELMKRNLDNPRRIWEHVVLNQLQPAAVQILILLFSFPADGVLIDRLEAALSRYGTESAYQTSYAEFRQSLKILDNTMVRISHERDGLVISYHNPSIRDYMRDYIASMSSIFSELLRSIVYFEQVEILWNQARARGADIILEQLVSSRTYLAGAIRHTYEGRTSKEGEQFHRSLIALEIAIECDLPDIEELIASKLAGMKLFPEEDSENPNIGDIAPMVNSLWKSQSPAIIDQREDIRWAVTEYLTVDLFDWEELRVAQSVLDEMRDNAPAYAVVNVRARLHDWTRQTLQGISDSGDISHYSQDFVREVLEFAAMYYVDLENEFPGYEIVTEMLESAIDEALEVEVKASRPPLEITDDASAINSIFRSLRDLSEQ